MADKRLWDYLKAISYTKDVSVLQDVDFEKVYEPFIINRALSHHVDAVCAANEMNERAHLPHSLQCLFLLNTLPSRFRKSDWFKNTTSDDCRGVAEYYGCSIRRARDLVSLHTSDQLLTIHSRLDKGGAIGKRSASCSPMKSKSYHPT